MQWTGSPETANGVTCREFTVTVEGRKVPVALWTPEKPAGKKPLVLVGHGGSGHKKSQLVLDMLPLVTQHGYSVAAIDGPVHGARRASPPPCWACGACRTRTAGAWATTRPR